MRKPPGSLDAWSAYQRGLWHLTKATKDDNTLAEKFFRQAISLDPNLEQEIAESVTQTRDGEYLAMDPARAQTVVRLLSGEVEQATGMGLRPVLLCSGRIRRHLRRLIEQALPQLPVVSYNEILPGIRVESTGVVAG